MLPVISLKDLGVLEEFMIPVYLHIGYATLKDKAQMAEYQCSALHDGELVVINALVRKTWARKIFEFGTFRGGTTYNLLKSAPKATVYTLDLGKDDIETVAVPNDEKPYVGIEKPMIANEDNIIQLWGDSAKLDLSYLYGEIDFVFIDGCHNHDYVINDTEKALFLIGKKGVILWHDYNPSYSNWGVTLALNELRVNQGLDIRHIKGTTLAILVKE